MFKLFSKPAPPATLIEKQGAAAATVSAALSAFYHVADDLTRAAQQHEAVAEAAHDVADQHRSLARASEQEAERARIAAANVYDLIGL